MCVCIYVCVLEMESVDSVLERRVLSLQSEAESVQLQLQTQRKMALDVLRESIETHLKSDDQTRLKDEHIQRTVSSLTDSSEPNVEALSNSQCIAYCHGLHQPSSFTPSSKVVCVCSSVLSSLTNELSELCDSVPTLEGELGDLKAVLDSAKVAPPSEVEDVMKENFNNEDNVGEDNTQRILKFPQTQQPF